MGVIVLGVTGGIGAYKAVEVARGLQTRGHEVVTVMTRAARQFVGEVTFEAITRRRVVSDQWTPGMNADIEHISLAADAQLLLVVPATANTLGKFAHGIADDFLSSLYLATTAPVLLAPAMNTNMLAHGAVQGNLATLRERGVHIVEPGEGYLACGWIGKGRLADVDVILDAADRVLTRRGRLAGRKIVVTAGPTLEDLDPVRFIGNRSSGKMGYAMADELARRAAHVVLVSGPSGLPPPAGVELLGVRSAADMHRAVMQHVASSDVVVMAAAVANYTPESVAERKIAHGGDGFTVRLVPTSDILADLAAWRQRQGGSRPLLVGFAAETDDVIERARAKRLRKGIDAIVANDVSRRDAGFESDTNAVTIIDGRTEEEVSLRSKAALAALLADRIETWLGVAAPAETAP